MFSPLLDAAAELAAQWHDGTYRKGRWRPIFPGLDGRIPLVAHVSAVALAVARAGFDDATVAAALLHDALEDPHASGLRLDPAALEAATNARVRALVEAVTEPKLGPDGQPMRWQDRKDAYLRTLAAAPVEAAAISLADKQHNLWTMNETLAAGLDVFQSEPGRIGLSAGPAQQRWYVDAVLAATEHHDDPRLDGLRAAVRAELARFERLTGLHRED